MRKSFFNCLKTSLTIIGSVIGAGFISGKEILEFFSFDFSLSGVYLAFICFCLCFYLIMSIDLDGAIEKAVGVFVSIANIVIAGCMVSGLEEVYSLLFGFTENIKILSILSVILVFIMTYNGIGFAEKFNSIFMPFLLVLVVCLSLYKTNKIDINLSPKTTSGVFKPFIYVGFNSLLSFSVIKNSGEKLSPPIKVLCCVLTSFVLCSCILLMSFAIFNEKILSVMPFQNLFIDNVKLFIIVEIITLFAIYSTLISSVYSSVNFGGVKLKFRYKFVILLSIIYFSYIGFNTIVERLYPILGALGYLAVLIIFLSRAVFRRVRQGRTYHLLKRIE